jgi:hypothetical protein
MLAAAPLGFAEDGTDEALLVSSVRDVVKAAADGRSDGEIIAAITSSKHPWLPKDVFEMLDAGVSEGIAKGTASKMGLFWEDWFQPLDVIGSEARQFGEANTLKLDDGNVVILFEWFNDIKYAKEAALKAVGPLAPKGSSELDREHDMRKRKHAVDTAKAVGVLDGKVEALTVELELTGEWGPFDARRGCGTAKLNKVVNEVDFFVFREVIGTLQSVSDVELKSRSVASLRFAADSDRRIESESFDVCTSESSYSSMAGKPVKLQATIKRTFDGVWSGRGEFVQGSNRIPAQR